MSGNEKAERDPEIRPDDDDVEGHGLLTDTDFQLQRKMGRDAAIEREARERQRQKEARVYKRER